MPTVRLPAPFLSYACQSTQVCCRHPLRAPCDPEDEERITKILASSEAGRARLPIFHTGFEQVRDMRAFKQVDERCVHLVPPSAPGDEEVPHGCSLQLIGGFEALAPACRNYPRWVTRVDGEDRSKVEFEALFLLACPTVASLLVRDPSPFRFVEVPLETWIYPPTRAVSPEEIGAVRGLRAGWWAVLAERRGDPERLLHVLDAMLKDPLEPRERADGDLHSALGLGLRSMDAGFVHDALERLPDRGPSYAALHWDLLYDVTRRLEKRSLLDALAIAPELLVAYLDHLIPFGGVHDMRPITRWLHTAVRRTLAVARMADSLLARVPYRIDTIFTDVFTAAIHLDAMDSPPIETT